MLLRISTVVPRQHPGGGGGAASVLGGVVLGAARPQLVIVIVQPVVFSLVCLAALLPALRGRRLGTYFAWRACELHFASCADSFRRRCLLLYVPCSSKLRRALSAFERPLLFTPSWWLLFLGIVLCVGSRRKPSMGQVREMLRKEGRRGLDTRIGEQRK